jgi:glycosyltransferase involved in cell wall biosynthesis
LKKIAIIGIRGIPVIYSGFETLAKKLATEAVNKGYRVTVYSRKSYYKKAIKSYKGVQIVYIPTIKSKNWETFIHSFFSTIHACFCRYDAILYLGVGSAIFSFFPRLFGTKTVINVDGLDWKREKWGSIAKKYLKISELIALYAPNIIITDSFFIKQYYLNNYKKETHYIPYGTHDTKVKDAFNVLKKLALIKNKYYVWVGRIVPDNHLDELIQAFKTSKVDKKCVIIGDDSHNTKYRQEILNLIKNDKQFIFTGFLDSNKYAEIVKNAYVYIETKRSGGTHPSLTEAMGFGSVIISNNHKANRLVLGETAYYYDLNKPANSLCQQIKKIDKLPKKTIVTKKKQVKIRAKQLYSWKSVINEYLRLFT